MSMTRKGKWVAIAIAALSVAAVGAVVAKRITERNAESQKREAEAKRPKILELSPNDVITAGTRMIAPMLTLTGALEPVSQGVAKARAAGMLVGAVKREGDDARRGEVLATVDAIDLKMRLAQQESLRAQALAQFETARKNRTAQQGLLDKGFISQTAFDNADGSYQAAKASVDAAQAQVNLAAQAIRDTTVISPIDGIVSRRHVEPGERVTNEMTIYTIVQIDTLEFAPQVPVEDATRLRIGQALDINVPGEDKPRNAVIARIAPTANAGTRTIDVRARLSNPERTLKAGTPVTGGVALAAPASAVVVPLETIRAADSAPHVFVLLGEQVKRVNLKLGARDEKTASITIVDGVKVGDRIVSARVQDLKEGQTVKLGASANAGVPTAQLPAPGPAAQGAPK